MRTEFDAEPDRRIALAAERVRRTLAYDSERAITTQQDSSSNEPTVFIQRDVNRPRRPSGPIAAGGR